MRFTLDIRALKAFFTSCLLVLVSLGLALPSVASPAPSSSVSFETTSSKLTKHSCADHQQQADHTMAMDCCDDEGICADDMACAQNCVSSNVLTSFVLPGTSIDVFAAITKTSMPQIKSIISWSTQLDAPPPRG